MNLPNQSSIELNNVISKLDQNKIRIFVPTSFLETHKRNFSSFKEGAFQFKIREERYRYFVKRIIPAPLWFVNNFAEKFNLPICEDELILTARSKKIKLPLRMTPKLAYFLGYLQGDGCLTSDKKYVYFFDEDKEQVDLINNLSGNLFAIKGIIKETRSKISLKPCYFVRINSLVLNSYLHEVFEIPLGVKERLNVPYQVKVNDKILAYYLAGLFDSDGTLPRNPSECVQLFIDLTFKQKEFILEIKDLLDKFGIRTLKIYKRIARNPTDMERRSVTWELRIRKHSDLLKFLDVVPFVNPNKHLRAIKLKNILMGA